MARSGRPKARSQSASTARWLCSPLIRWYVRSSAIAVCHSPAWYAARPTASRTAEMRDASRRAASACANASAGSSSIS